LEVRPIAAQPKDRRVQAEDDQTEPFRVWFLRR
jgi:hypothetical protein